MARTQRPRGTPSGISSIAQRWYKLRERRNTALVLRGLDDHMLHDIGLTRREAEELGKIWK